MSDKFDMYMRKHIVRALCKCIIAAGYLIEYDNDCSDTDCKMPLHYDYKTIVKRIFDEENSCELYLYDNLSGGLRGWINLRLHNEGWNVISDYSVNIENLIKPVNDLQRQIEKKWYK